MNFFAYLAAGMCWLAISACNAANGDSGTSAGRGGTGAGNAAGTSQGGASVAGNGGGPLASAGASSIGGGGANSGGTSAGGSANAGGAGMAAGASSGSTGVAGGSGGGAGSACGASGLLFCEDFEKLAAGPVPNAGPWTTSYIGPDAPTIIVDASTPAHSGTHSVMVHAPLSNFQSFLVFHDPAVLPRTQGEFYLRSYVRLGREMAEHHNTYLILDQFTSPGAGAAVRLGEQANMLSLTVGGDAHGSLSNNKFSQDGMLGAHFVANSWACLEGHFNSAQPEIDFWIHDVEISDFHHTDWPADNYDTLRFGFEKYAGPELDIWFDDIAISATRIGCQ